MAPVAQPFRHFFSELKRRHVIRAVVAYAAALWLLIQIGEATFEPLGISDSVLATLVVVGVLGFPVVALLSWFLPFESVVPATAGVDGEVAPGAVAPEGATADRPRTVLNNLPAPPTPLVGRGEELGEAGRVLAEACRILTITGPAGVGKTRLMLELGHRLLSSHENGACFVPAGSLSSPEALPFLLAERLGLGAAPGEDPWVASLSFLREKRLLLLVDNFEQIPAGGAMLSELSASAPGVVLVVTSRERLGLKGEAVLGLTGLAYPRPDDTAAGEPGSFPAVRLFTQSARRVARSFEVGPSSSDDVVRLCELVDGLPLALELAAGCVGVLSVAEITREIEQRHDVPLGSARDSPPRHWSLRAAFESSWVLLDPAEQNGFRRLAVFRGGFDRDAAKHVAGAELPMIAGLLDKSLLRRPDPARLDMLEIIRQFAEEKLDEDAPESAAARDRHAEYYAELLEELVRRSDEGEAGAALERIAADADNIRAAWEWMLEGLDFDGLSRSADGLFRFWEARGWIREGRELFRRAARSVDDAMASQPPDPRSARLLARLLAREGAFAELGDAYEEARDILERARSLLVTDEDTRELANVLCTLSFAARASGEFERGHSLATESLELYRSLSDAAGTATSLNSLGAQCFSLGRYEEAKEHYRAAVAIFRELGDSHGLWKPLNNLAGVAVVENDYEEARRLLEEALEHQRGRGSRRGEGLALQNLGLVSYRAGNHAEAERVLQEAVVIAEDAGYRGILSHALNTLGAVRLARGDAEGALGAYRRALSTACDVRDLPLALTILMGVAQVRASTDDPEPAVSVLRVVSTHPACDEDTRAEARALLAELGETAAAADSPAADPPELEELRALGMRGLVGSG